MLGRKGWDRGKWAEREAERKVRPREVGKEGEGGRDAHEPKAMSRGVSEDEAGSEEECLKAMHVALAYKHPTYPRW